MAVMLFNLMELLHVKSVGSSNFLNNSIKRVESFYFFDIVNKASHIDDLLLY